MMNSLAFILIFPLLGALILFLCPKNFKLLSTLHVLISAVTSAGLLCNVGKLISGNFEAFYAYDKFLFLDSLGCVFLVLIAVTGFLVNLPLFSNMWGLWGGGCVSWGSF